MKPDEEIDRLDAEIERHMEEHPQKWATLRITNTAFRACTKSRWEANNWSISDDEVGAILNGNDEERKTALRSLLRAHYIHDVEIVPGVNIIDVVANPNAVDEV